MTAPKCSAQIFLAAMIIAGFFAVLYSVLHGGMPDKGSDAVLMLIGVLASAFKDSIGYYFNSSSGSRDKQNMIENLTGKGQNAAATPLPNSVTPSAPPV
ncbi:MAG: hypothetical protein WBG19_09660 [Thermoplasmata archaeon]